MKTLEAGDATKGKVTKVPEAIDPEQLLTDLHNYFENKLEKPTARVASMDDLKTEMCFLDSCFKQSINVAEQFAPSLAKVLATLRIHNQKNTADVLFVYLREKDEWKSRLQKERRGRQKSSKNRNTLLSELNAQKLLNTTQAKSLGEMKLKLAEAMLKSGDEADRNKALVIVQNVMKEGTSSNDLRRPHVDVEAQLNHAKKLLEEIQKAKAEAQHAKEELARAKMETRKLEEAARIARLKHDGEQNHDKAIPPAVDERLNDEVFPKKSSQTNISVGSPASYRKGSGSHQLSALQEELEVLRQSSAKKIAELQNKLREKTTPQQQDLIRNRKLEPESLIMCNQNAEEIAPTRVKQTLIVNASVNESTSGVQLAKSMPLAPCSNQKISASDNGTAVISFEDHSSELNLLKNELAASQATLEALRAKMLAERMTFQEMLASAQVSSNESTKMHPTGRKTQLHTKQVLDVQSDLAEALKLLLKFRDSTDVFDTFSDGDITELADFLDIVPFKDSDPIIAQGEEASWAGFILDGVMSVKVNGNKVATMKTGSILGELAVLEGGKRTATCEGEGSGVIGAIPFEILDTMHRDAPELAVKLFTAFGAAGVSKLRARLANNTSSNSGESGNGKGAKKLKKRRRKRIDTKGRGKKKSDANFTASSSAEVFYRSMVAKAERETDAAEAQKKETEERMKKMQQKQKTERMLRKRAERKMEEMKAEIMRLQAEASEQKGVDDPQLHQKDQDKPLNKLKSAAHMVGVLAAGLKNKEEEHH
eukprot:g2484.t1